MFHDQIATFRQKYNDVFYAFFRVLLGLLFAFHGAQKLFGLYADKGAQPLLGGMSFFGVNLLFVAGVIEFFGGLLIVFGFLTGVASIISALDVIAAYFVAHFTLASPVPLVNHGELALVYLVAFVFILLEGGGKYSLDFKIWGKKAAPAQVAAQPASAK